jgi:hypothetical protein
MSISLKDLVGYRGEKLFELAISEYSMFPQPLFRPGFLGEKWPAIDFYVELLGVRRRTPFFFVQVKSTAAAIPFGATHLNVSLPPKKREFLFRVPGPTYLAGVHEPSRRTFILSINAQSPQGVYKMPLQHELNPANLQILYNEVKAFWNSHDYKPQNSHFV